jgi:hypothetical protein
VPASPRWRFRKAALREFAALLPWLVAVLVANAVVGWWAGILILGAVIVVATARLALTRSSPALRRAGIRIVRLGTGGEPERWRLVVYRLAPVVLLVPLVAISTTGSNLFFVALAAYVAMWIAGFRRATRHGRDLDPMLALAGLDVAWAGAPPTPSGTSEPPAPAPPPPTPAAPATPGPAPRRGRPGRRSAPR